MVHGRVTATPLAEAAVREKFGRSGFDRTLPRAGNLRLSVAGKPSGHSPIYESPLYF
jgi:hypothetical protein